MKPYIKNTSNPKAPCFKCEDRSPSCHKDCPDYQEFAKDNETARDKRREERADNAYFYTCMKTRYRRKRQK